MNLLAFFPELQRELDLAFKDAVGRVTKPSFQHSKERFIIAEVFFHKKSDLTENDRRELVVLIKDAGDSKELKACLRNWGSPSTGALPSLLSRFTSLFNSKEWISDSINEATRKTRDIQDWAFITTLQEKVLKEPFLQQLAQEVMTETYAYLREFMKKQLPKLYLRAYNIKQKRMYHQVEAEAKDQDQKRRASSRRSWFNEINMVQTQVTQGYALYYLQIYLPLFKCLIQAPGHSVYQKC